MNTEAVAHLGPLKSGVSRRAFLKAGAASGGGLLLSFVLDCAEGNAAEDTFAPNAFIRIDRNGAVTMVMPQVEMGQGTYTSMPMLIAEELEVELSKVRLEHAPADDKLYGNPITKFQVTGGSTSVRAFWEPLRRAGATARNLLIAAAAQTWGVNADACRAEKGEIIHVPTGRRVSYGNLVDVAATLPVPEKVALRDPKDFKLIGTPVKRLDAPEKVNGTAQYGIDVRIPGMKVATVAACPVFGGKLESVDDSKAKTIKGVVQIVHLDDAVAVVADHMAAAKKGLAALDIKWNEGQNAGIGMIDIIGQLDAASKNHGAVGRKEGDVEKAMAGAVTKVEAIYQVPFLAHATMEPMNCTVHVRSDSCDVWVGTQVAARAQRAAAEVTGLPLEKVQVHNHLLGGGFGRRLDIDGSRGRSRSQNR
jgi:isoquinoline 1-oxidoreductase beta subunit